MAESAEYTEIPREYIDNYDDWFDVKKIQEEHGDILTACEAHPVYFAYFMLGIKARDYQVYELDLMLQNKKIFDLWGRRMGKSAKNKIFGAWAMWYNKYPSGMYGTTQILVIAHEQGEADAYVSDIREMYIQGDDRVNKVFNGQLGKNYFTKTFPKRGSNAKNDTQSFSIYKDGGWQTLRAYPPTDRARGKGASIIFLDEVAFWYKNTPDPFNVYYKVVRPVITDSPDTRIYGSTTPDGRTGLAYEIIPIDAHKSPYKLVWMPYYYRRDKAYLDEMAMIEDEYRDQGKYNDFRQEYLAELVEQSESYFEAETEVHNVFRDEHLYRWYDSYANDCHFAIDFGGSKNSHTVITGIIYEENTKNLIRIFHKRYPIAKDSNLQLDILDIKRRFPNIVTWHIDSQGGGSSFYSWFRDVFGSHSIDEVSFRKDKEGMYRQFKIACYQDRIKTYPDKDLFNEFISFTRDMRPMKGYTDDMLDAFVMACRDYLEDKEEYEYKVLRY